MWATVCDSYLKLILLLDLQNQIHGLWLLEEVNEVEQADIEREEDIGEEVEAIATLEEGQALAGTISTLTGLRLKRT